jgi:hypothetical protein
LEVQLSLGPSEGRRPWKQVSSAALRDVWHSDPSSLAQVTTQVRCLNIVPGVISALADRLNVVDRGAFGRRPPYHTINRSATYPADPAVPLKDLQVREVLYDYSPHPSTAAAGCFTTSYGRLVRVGFSPPPCISSTHLRVGGSIPSTDLVDDLGMGTTVFSIPGQL